MKNINTQVLAGVVTNVKSFGKVIVLTIPTNEYKVKAQFKDVDINSLSDAERSNAFDTFTTWHKVKLFNGFTKTQVQKGDKVIVLGQTIHSEYNGKNYSEVHVKNATQHCISINNEDASTASQEMLNVFIDFINS